MHQAPEGLSTHDGEPFCFAGARRLIGLRHGPRSWYYSGAMLYRALLRGSFLTGLIGIAACGGGGGADAPRRVGDVDNVVVAVEARSVETPR